MSRGYDGEGNSPAIQVLAAIAVMALAGVIAFLWSAAGVNSTRREMAQHVAIRHCEESPTAACTALEASIRSAAAAEASADVAGEQLWLNFLGLIGVGATVIYARAAWLAARQSARVASAAMEHSRAHIVAEIGGVEIKGPGEKISGAVLLKNVGQTPAYNVSSNIKVEIVKLGTHDTIPDFDEVERIQLIVGPGLDKKTTKNIEKPLTKDQYDDLVDKKSIVIVGGTIVYDDIFGKSWWTQFCHTYHWPEFSGAYHPQLNRAGGPIGAGLKGI